MTFECVSFRVPASTPGCLYGRGAPAKRRYDHRVQRRKRDRGSVAIRGHAAKGWQAHVSSEASLPQDDRRSCGMQRVAPQQSRGRRRLRLHEGSGQRRLRRPDAPTRAAGAASCSLALGVTNPVPEAAEIALINGSRDLRCGTIEQELAQALTILIGADQLADIFAARGV